LKSWGVEKEALKEWGAMLGKIRFAQNKVKPAKTRHGDAVVREKKAEDKQRKTKKGASP